MQHIKFLVCGFLQVCFSFSCHWLSINKRSIINILISINMARNYSMPILFIMIKQLFVARQIKWNVFGTISWYLCIEIYTLKCAYCCSKYLRWFFVCVILIFVPYYHLPLQKNKRRKYGWDSCYIFSK